MSAGVALPERFLRAGGPAQTDQGQRVPQSHGKPLSHRCFSSEARGVPFDNSKTPEGCPDQWELDSCAPLQTCHSCLPPRKACRRDSDPKSSNVVAAVAPAQNIHGLPAHRTPGHHHEEKSQRGSSTIRRQPHFLCGHQHATRPTYSASDLSPTFAWNNYSLCLKNNLKPPIIQEKLRSPQLRQQGQSCSEDRTRNMLRKVWMCMTPHTTHQ